MSEKKIWGTRTKIFSGNCVEVYLLSLRPAEDGQPISCSWHHHAMKHNRFFPLSGTLTVEAIYPERRIAEWEGTISRGLTATIPPGHMHRFIVTEPAEVIEVTWADSITEDIIRKDIGHILKDWPGHGA